MNSPTPATLALRVQNSPTGAALAGAATGYVVSDAILCPVHGAGVLVILSPELAARAEAAAGLGTEERKALAHCLLDAAARALAQRYRRPAICSIIPSVVHTPGEYTAVAAPPRVADPRQN